MDGHSVTSPRERIAEEEEAISVAIMEGGGTGREHVVITKDVRARGKRQGPIERTCDPRQAHPGGAEEEEPGEGRT